METAKNIDMIQHISSISFIPVCMQNTYFSKMVVLSISVASRYCLELNLALSSALPTMYTYTYVIQL